MLDLGGSVGQEAQAGVTMEVDDNAQEVQIEVTSLGNSDKVDIKGLESSEIKSGESNLKGLGVGDSVTIGDSDNGADVDLQAAYNARNSGSPTSISGTVTAVAIIQEDDTQTQVASEDFDFDYS